MQSKRDTVPLTHPLLKRIGAIADREQIEAYVVGGYVRDLLLGKTDADMDVVVVGDGIAFAQQVAGAIGARNVVTFERFGTAMVPHGGGKIEFVGARREAYEAGSRKPNVQGGSLDEDLRRRDFTINAMAASLNSPDFGLLLDPLGGREDLARRVLRTPLDPETTFQDDPLRMMRGIRFAAQLQFTIEEHVLRAIGTVADQISVVSQERITDELMKILAAPRPSVGLILLFNAGLLTHVFPEISNLAGTDQRRDHHHKDVFRHTCIVVDNIARATEDVWLRFVALVHDIAKPRTKEYKEGTGWTFHGHEELGARMMKSVFRRLRLPTEHLPYVEKLVRLHLRPMVLVDDIVTDSAVRRLIFDAGNDIDDLMTLCRADITSKNPQLVTRYLKNYDIVMDKIREVEEKDRLRNWQPPVRGEEIMQLCGLEPGKPVGMLKKAIEEAILEGTIPNDHDAAVQYLLRIKEDVLANLK